MTAFPLTLVKGANIRLKDLDAALAHLTVLLAVDDPDGGVDLDIAVLLLTSSEQVRDSDDFIFYNQPVGAAGAVHLRDRLRDEANGRTVDSISITLDELPPDITRVLLVGSLGDADSTFGHLSGLNAVLQDSSAALNLVECHVQPEGPERALVFGEFYVRDGDWRFRAIAQGYEGGLPHLLGLHGVEVTQEAPGSESDPAQPHPAPDAQATPEDEVDRSQREIPRRTEGQAAEGRDAKTSVSVARRSRPPQLPKDWNRSIPENSDSDLQPARLFPIAGIGSKGEQERRATSTLLAVVSIVREFGHSLFKPFGAPAGTVSAYTEVPFGHDGQAYRPDGLVVVRRGQRTWRALVEVKTSGAPLTTEQVSVYVDIAKEQGFDAVVTISNLVAARDEDHPAGVDRRKLRKVGLHHLSWAEIRTQASLLLAASSLDDTRTRLLSEFLRYAEHERSGLHGFSDMGPRWPAVRDAVKAQTMRPTDVGVRDVIGRFDELVRQIALDLSAALGTAVRASVPGQQRDQASRLQQLADSGLLFGSLRVPGATETIVLRLDMRSDLVTASLVLSAPRTGRPTTRINWLVRQLEGARASCRIEADAAGAKHDSRAELLETVRADPSCLSLSDGRDIRQFTVSYTAAMGTKRASSSTSLASSVNTLVHDFYGEVVQNIRPWRP